jgi:epoxyqueuosine reductase
LKEAIRQQALLLGFDDCRFAAATPPRTTPMFQAWLQAGHHGTMAYLQRNADRRMDPQRVLPGARTAISLAAAYPASEPHLGVGPARSPSPLGRVARYAQARDYHHVLAQPLRDLAHYVQLVGGPATRTRTYTDTGPLLERAFGQESGLGFVGKHTNLISRRLGNWFVLAEILTTLDLEPDPPQRNHCGSCTRCLASCPTRAIVAPFQLDARLCISYLTIELKGPIPEPLRALIGDRIFGCDDCLEACPWNRFARAGRLLQQAARPGLARPDLLQLLQLDDTAFRQQFRDTPLWRGKRPRLLRNVCVALGNVGDSEALPALHRAGSDPDPLIAEHARWAARRIQARSADGSDMRRGSGRSVYPLA